MEALFRALPKLLKEFEDTEEVREAVVFAAWRSIAGESLSEHTVPFRLFNKHLIIHVADKMWKRHLETLSGQMIFKLNSALGQAIVTFIEFRVDEETLRAERAKHHKTQMTEEERREIALEEVTPNLRRSADAIKDDNLRYQFLLAAGSCLARKEKMKNKP
jgi:predicted nucleic acid-binding Zn ribbon protein